MNSLTPIQVPDRERDEQPRLAPRRRRRWWALAGVALTVILSLVGWRWYRSQQIERALAAIRSRGEPVTPAELYAMLPRVPSDQDCFALYEADESTWMRPYRSQLVSIAPFSWDRVLPGLDEPWQDQAIAEKFLDGCRTEFARWHQAAEKGGAANFPIHAEEGYGGLFLGSSRSTALHRR